MYYVGFNGRCYEVHSTYVLPAGAKYIGHDLWVDADDNGIAYRLID